MFNIVSRDLQCTTAKNLKLVRDSSGLNPWTAGPYKLKEALHQNQMVDIPQQDVWKVGYLRSLLGQLQEAKHLVQEDKTKYIQGLIDSLAL